MPTIEEFNANKWKASYPSAVRDTVFFALDTFGFPFGISGDVIVQLDPETGVLSRMADTIGHLCDRVRTEPDEIVGLNAFDTWIDAGRTLAINQRIAPKIPFLFKEGGNSLLDDFYEADILERAAFNAFIYEQTKDLPDGALIELQAVS